MSLFLHIISSLPWGRATGGNASGGTATGGNATGGNATRGNSTHCGGGCFNSEQNCCERRQMPIGLSFLFFFFLLQYTVFFFFFVVVTVFDVLLFVFHVCSSSFSWCSSSLFVWIVWFGLLFGLFSLDCLFGLFVLGWLVGYCCRLGESKQIRIYRTPRKMVLILKLLKSRDTFFLRGVSAEKVHGKVEPTGIGVPEIFGKFQGPQKLHIAYTALKMKDNIFHDVWNAAGSIPSKAFKCWIFNLSVG